jgi:hypothetical protein
MMKACDVGGCITPLILNLNTKVVPSLTTGCGRFSPREEYPVPVEYEGGLATSLSGGFGEKMNHLTCLQHYNNIIFVIIIIIPLLLLMC